MTVEATTKFPDWLHWGDYPSQSAENPDVLKIKVTSLDIFPLEYSDNITAMVNGMEKNIPLWNYQSKNTKLLRDFKSHIASGKIKVGKEFTLTTYNQVGFSKNNPTWKIRRWNFIF